MRPPRSSPARHRIGRAATVLAVVASTLLAPHIGPAGATGAVDGSGDSGGSGGSGGAAAVGATSGAIAKHGSTGSAPTARPEPRPGTIDDDLAWDDTPPPAADAPAPPPVSTPVAPTTASTAQAASPLASEPVRLINANGGWCWWQGARAIITDDGRLLAASTPSTRGAGGRGRATDVATYDLAAGRSDVSTLMSGRLRSDDHNSGAVIQLPSGRIVTAWAGHSQEPYVHTAWQDPGSYTWQVREPIHRPESTASLPSEGGFGSRAMVTYSNLVWVAAENAGRGRLYDFFRGRGDQPVFMYSDDEAVSWTYGGEVFARPGSRPYVHWAAGTDRVWFTASLGHPHSTRFDPVYAGYIRAGRMYRSDGTYVTDLGRPVDVTRFTLVHQSSFTAPVDWGPPSYRAFDDTDAWGSDLRVDASGAPVVTFSVRRPERSPVAGKLFVQEYWWARLDPATAEWKVVRLGHGGSELYREQLSYSGLVAVDPTDAFRVFAATDVHPVAGTPLISSSTGRAQHEIWEARSADRGTTWTWAPVTRDSAADNLRPTVAARGDAWALLWLRGTYTDFEDDYDQAVVGIVRPGADPPATSLLSPRAVVGVADRAVVGDFDGDGSDDTFVYRPGPALDSIVFTRGEGRRPGRFQVAQVSGTYTPVAGDFDRNGVDDIAWYAPADGTVSIWSFDRGGSYRTSTLTGLPRHAAVRVGDFDGNRHDDLFAHAGRSTAVWLRRAAGGWVRMATPVSTTAYVPVVGDFTGDGASDIAWYRPGGAATTWWDWQPGRRTWSTRSFPSVWGRYRPIVGDLDGDRRDDIWFSDAPGTNVWLGSGWERRSAARVTGAVGIASGATGRPVAVIDVAWARVIRDRTVPAVPSGRAPTLGS